MAAMNKGNYTFKAGAVISSATITITVFNMNLVFKAVENGILRFLAQTLPRLGK